MSKWEQYWEQYQRLGSYNKVAHHFKVHPANVARTLKRAARRGDINLTAYQTPPGFRVGKGRGPITAGTHREFFSLQRGTGHGILSVFNLVRSAGCTAIISAQGAVAVAASECWRGRRAWGLLASSLAPGAAGLLLPTGSVAPA